MSQESRIRSILKAITWRIIATGTTFLLAYIVFSNSECEDVLRKSSIVAGLEVILKIIIYYFHERIWQHAPEVAVEKILTKKE